MKVIYIAGCTHGGTTLLHRLLGAMAGVHSLGSVKNLPSTRGRVCSCGERLERCKYWCLVLSELERGGDAERVFENINAHDGHTFEMANCRLFQAAQVAANCSVLVDSSRKVHRLRKLKDYCPNLDLRVVHLFRRPEAQVYSWMRREPDTVTNLAHRYVREHRAIEREVGKCAQRNVLTCTFSYEDLCKDPMTALRTLSALADVQCEPDMLTNWGQQEHHVLGGNRMLKSTSSEITVDERWKWSLGQDVVDEVESVCSETMDHLHKKLR